MAVMKNNKKILIDLFIKIYIMRNQSRWMSKIKIILKMIIKYIVFLT
jgi:hypothetical protein